MARGYGQYCPLSLATELLCQRWTMLVVSRLVDGCTRFNEIHRGVSQMSPSLLSRRLSELEAAGVIEIRETGKGKGREYLATEAGLELAPLIDAMAIWGQRWGRDMEMEDLDPGFLVWSMHLRMNVEAMPPGRTVLEFDFSGAPTEFKQFWIVNKSGTVEMCLKDPGLDVDLLVTSDLRLFIEAWRGFRDLRKEIKARRIRLFGDAELKRQFPDWLLLSALAPYARERAGRERQLARRTSGAGR